jgi:hypothetical protein
VFFRVVFGGLFRMVHCVQMMAVSYVSVMAGLLVITGFVVFGGRAMVIRRVFVVFCCFAMMFNTLFRHSNLSGSQARLRALGPR